MDTDSRPAASGHGALRLRIRPKRPIDGAVTGEFLSVFKGRGSEFEELREYAPGDDVRTIDWKVTARTGRPFVRQYIEERELTVIVAVDLSASLRSGSGALNKDAMARAAAASIMYATIGNNDRAGLLLFSDRVDSWTRPQKGKGHAVFLEERLRRARPEGRGTDLRGALIRLGIVAKRRSLLFVLSDFMAPDFERPLRALALRHDVIPVVFRDPLDDALPAAGLVAIRDLETGEAQLVDFDHPRVRAHYEAAALRRLEERWRVFTTLGLKPLEIMGGADPVQALVQYFMQRAGVDASRATASA